MTYTWLGLAGWLLASFAAGGIGALATRRARAFYADIVKPRWAPPGWLFGPVWTALYIMMGVAAWLAWRDAGWRGATVALTLFVVQLVCNALWSWIFFAWRRAGVAFAEIVVLFALVLATHLAFSHVNGTAALLLVPYLVWVAFAGALNFAIWRANGDRMGVR